MKNQLYKLIINDVTNYCYENCLDYFSKNSAILDVGIGNGVMMKNYHSLIKSKGLKITGIDINKNYLNHCESLIKTYQLENYIEIYNKSVESYVPPKKNYFDFVLFSMSFMLFKDQWLVLDHVKDWLKPSGKIVFFQTMFKERSTLIDFIKPKLKYLTTIDFGKVTYEDDFFALLNAKNLSVSEDRLIKREWFNGEYRMIATCINGEKRKNYLQEQNTTHINNSPI
jgi:ubiquinone/menaquinone biosynthesis C-methylase UbiE